MMIFQTGLIFFTSIFMVNSRILLPQLAEDGCAVGTVCKIATECKPLKTAMQKAHSSEKMEKMR